MDLLTARELKEMGDTSLLANNLYLMWNEKLKDANMGMFDKCSLHITGWLYSHLGFTKDYLIELLELAGYMVLSFNSMDLSDFEGYPDYDKIYEIVVSWKDE